MKNNLFKLLVICIFCVGFVFVIGNFKSPSENVGQVRMNIPTYYAGKDQVTHPSVYNFDSPWNGYRYWMAYTPYPNANGEEENPSIVASNDLYKWEVPYGMTNPIANNEETGCNELKDSHILFRDDLDRLEVWYLGRVSENLGGDNSTLTIFRKYSYDGVHWSEFEIMSQTNYLSQSVIWDGEKYKMWGIGFSTYNTEGKLVYQESTDGINWTIPEQCAVDGSVANIEIWHGSVSYYCNKYYLVYIKDVANSQEIICCESEDGKAFGNSETIINNDKTGRWKYFYRPYLLYDDLEYVVLYGVVNDANEWYITMSKGNTIDNLQGITNDDINKMTTLESTVTNTSSIRYGLKKIYYQCKNAIRLELLALVAVILITKMWRRDINGIKRITIEFGACLFMCLVYSLVVFRTVQIPYIICICITSAVEAVGITSVSHVISEIISLKNNMYNEK